MFEYHDLKKDPNDLPKTDDHVLLYVTCFTGFGAKYSKSSNEFYMDDTKTGVGIPPYYAYGWISIPALFEIEDWERGLTP